MFNEKFKFFICLYFSVTSWVSKSQEGRDINSTFRTNWKFQRRVQFCIIFLDTVGSCIGAVMFTLMIFLTEEWDSKIRKSFTTLICIQTCSHVVYTFYVAPKIRKSNTTRQLLYIDNKLTG